MILDTLAVWVQSASPDADKARQWAEQELTKAEYLAAQPTAFDRASLAVIKFFEDLLSPDLGDSNGGALIVAVLLGLLITAALVVGILLWGKPRASRRLRATQMLLGEEDRLSASELRRAAEQSARSGEWGRAMTQRYRALARGLAERELIDPAPGSTAQSIAHTAALVFPAQRDSLLEAAGLFDGVRYQGIEGNEHDYLAIRTADENLSSPPRLASPGPSGSLPRSAGSLGVQVDS